MVVVLGEDQSLRHGGASREDLGEQPVAESFQNGTDLTLIFQPACDDLVFGDLVDGGCALM
ncbi:hypothetical protein, partial [Mycobacterium helveticum]|uniref:hypothetical protein n=1 Tax=Mycobacterium helveticum TaxID=2592811 RepID=UPI001FEF720B